ncbi:MAG: serine/threonine-protein kinase, partial [Thermoguttaceae bacterium]
MAIKTCDSFLEALEKSDLLDADQLATARQLARQTDDPRTLAILLVQKELLTRWQAGQLLAGRTSFFLGRYKLIDLLGRGGMGNVFLAQHTMMNRPVAIKMISRELSQDPASRERFLEEARAIAALDHPNIVHAYTVDSEADRYYMVLEFVEGQDLQRLVEAEGPLAFERAADYIRQAADGLAHAHAKGMIHCDIKPSNLLVNAQGVVKILDMGMSRLVGRAQEAPGEQGPAEEQKLLGTVDYLAPEQAVGSPDLDHRADIYSLGCTLYFLLTGSPPFPEGTLAERLLKHQIEEPPSILLSRPDAPRDLVKLCEKMMAKSPADRCNSAEEVSRFLAAWRPSAPRILKAVPLDQGAVPTEAATGRAGPRAKRRLKVLAWLGAALGSGRRRAAVLAALGLMAAALGGVSLAVWLHPFRQTQTADASAMQTSQPKPTSADQQEDEAARLWPGLKLAFDDKPTPAKPKPAAPSQPAPKLAKSGSPGPPAAAKPAQGPASPANSAPAAKPG